MQNGATLAMTNQLPN